MNTRYTVKEIKIDPQMLAHIEEQYGSMQAFVNAYIRVFAMHFMKYDGKKLRLSPAPKKRATK
jgi:hypothetical protein